MVRKMKKSVVLLCIVVVLGGFYFDQSKVPHQKTNQSTQFNGMSKINDCGSS